MPVITTLLSLLLLLPAPAATTPTMPAASPAATTADEKVLKALDAWLKAYRGGKIDFSSRKDLGKGSISDKFGVMPKGLIGAYTAERELEIMLEQAVALQSAAAAEVVLTVAAIGLDHGKVKYTAEMAPFAVRALAERMAQKLEQPEALAQVRKIALGEARTDAAFGAGPRAAAIRLLGAKKDGSAREVCETQLASKETPLRLAAAEALGLVADEQSAPSLAAALDGEINDIVVSAIVSALRSCCRPHMPSPKADAKTAAVPDSVRRVSAAVGKAIGKTNWRADMDLVKFLHDFAAVEEVPSLIDVLQRFLDKPEQVQSGTLSTLLLYRAHETLVALTGAVYGRDDVPQWRELWAKEKDNLIAARKPPAAAEDDKSSGTAAFCGIPAQGSRILFVVDLSGSMEFPMRPRGTATPGNEPIGQSRLSFAKKQMNKVVSDLPPETKLNIITFNGRPKAKLWNKDMIDASDKNKKKALEYVESWTAVYPPPNQADGGTNMWSGLEAALSVKSLVYGDRYETSVDEVFVLSDGAPSVGEIVDPLEILRLVTETNRFCRVRINTIFISSQDDRDPRALSMSPSELMKRMAEENGGRFAEFKD